MLNAAFVCFRVAQKHAEFEASFQVSVVPRELPAFFLIERHFRRFFYFVELVLSGGFRADSVFLDLTVETWAIDAQHVGGFLFVPAGALERALDHKLLDLFKRHVRWDVPGKSR